jgi:hypothetical protein
MMVAHLTPPRAFGLGAESVARRKPRPDDCRGQAVHRGNVGHERRHCHGGAGYVGSHACKALALAGYLPVVYDNLSTGSRWAARYGSAIFWTRPACTRCSGSTARLQ